MAQVNKRQSRAHISAEEVAGIRASAQDSMRTQSTWQAAIGPAETHTQSATARGLAESVEFRGASRGSGGWQHQHSGPHGQLS
jgi:hypothetical protein